MNHTDLENEAYELYVMGALDAQERAELETHLLSGCEYCSARLREAETLISAMAGTAPQVTPPAALRARVLATLAPAASRSRSTFYLVAGLAAACLALVAFTIWTGRQTLSAQEQVLNIRAERNDLRAALELMSRPETRAVQFGNIQNAPHGRVFVGGNGSVIFVGGGLPDLPTGKTFELWVVPAKGAPAPAGLFKPDAAGGVVEIATARANNVTSDAVAVTIEPLAGSQAPTGKPFLVIPLS